MITKSLFAAAAVATAFVAATPARQAEAKVLINLGINPPGFYPGYGYGGYYPVIDPYFGSGISCGKGRRIVKWHGFHNVNAVDCGAPVYQYNAWKGGLPYRVKVSLAGDIIRVKPLAW